MQITEVASRVDYPNQYLRRRLPREDSLFLEPYQSLLMLKLHIVGDPTPLKSELHFKGSKDRGNSDLVSLRLAQRSRTQPSCHSLGLKEHLTFHTLFLNSPQIL